jgi:hypothetical protein
LTGILLASCSAPTFKAESDFYYSDDAGATYGNGTKEYYVGDNVYMQLLVRITSSKKGDTTVGATLEIPHVKNVSASYLDGQPITPETDEVAQTETYAFNVVASDNPVAWKMVFQFVPLQEATVKCVLTFDDSVDAIYDKQNTINFIKRSSDTSSASSDSASSSASTSSTSEGA